MRKCAGRYNANDWRTLPMSTPNQNLPFQAVLALIEQLSGGGRLRLRWDQIRQILGDLTEGHFWLGYPMPSDWAIFRGRISNETKLFENVSQLSNRRVEDIKDYGRCHCPSTSVFYAANNLDTVLSELLPEIGDRVHIAVARPRKSKKVVLTAIGEIEHVRRFDRALIGNDETRKIIQKFLDNVKSEAELKTLLLDAFMSDLFITPADRWSDYKATSALSDIIFSAQRDGNPILDGFAYPSVAHRGGMNFAIQGARFAEQMEIYQCMAFEIINYLGFGIYGRTQYARSKAVAEDGTITLKAF